MDQTTFRGNVLLLAQVPASFACPAGTYQLALGDSNGQAGFLTKVYNGLANLWVKTYNGFARVLGKETMAAVIYVQKKYCVTPGATSYLHTAQNSYLYFTPTDLLQADVDYYVVVKGQSDLTNLASSTESGVLNKYGVGMAEYYDYTSVGSFNGQTFDNSYVWHFKTLSDSGATNGVCLVDYVTVDPAAYLFQSNTNDLNENDSDSTSVGFDTVSDRDKAYLATAWSSDDQILQPVSGYSWVWNWAIDDTTIANFSTVSGLTADGEEQLVTISAGSSDASTNLTAGTVMDSANVIVSTDKSQEVPIRIFICANPWPPVVAGSWSPAKDTSLGCVSGNCSNYSYEFYYCRDSGDESTTADDLPAISSGTGIVSVGQSSRKVCSNNRNLACTVDGDCGAGAFCIWDILKESYFFEQ
jgi:hypothetical protein